MRNPALQERDEQFDKEFPRIEIVGENEADGTFVLEKDREKVKSFIHKVIAERDEALRKEIQEISNNTYEDTNPFYVLGKVASLLSKE